MSDDKTTNTCLHCGEGHPAQACHVIQCTMCNDTHECPECGSETPSEDCTMCFGRGDCPECGDGSNYATEGAENAE